MFLNLFLLLSQVDSVEDVTDHVHDVDPDFVKNPSKNMRWPDEATAIVLECVQNRQLPAATIKNGKIQMCLVVKCRA